MVVRFGSGQGQAGFGLRWRRVEIGRRSGGDRAEIGRGWERTVAASSSLPASEYTVKVTHVMKSGWQPRIILKAAPTVRCLRMSASSRARTWLGLGRGLGLRLGLGLGLGLRSGFGLGLGPRFGLG